MKPGAPICHMPTSRPPSQALLDDIKQIVGKGGWKDGRDADGYFDDPRERFTGQGSIVVLPKSTAEVSSIVGLCNSEGAAIIPYGGGTGVVAGQLSIDSANVIILSLERMNRVRSLSVEDGVMVAEAGCILEHVHAVAEQSDLMFPLSMASKGSCSIGGNLATNAGGIQVLRYGNARDLCLGIEAVMADGSILSELSPLRKNNTGYDLRHLLIGSEGTLGIITAASLILKPVDPEVVTTLCALKSPEDALSLFKFVRAKLGENIAGLELMSAFGMRLVARHFPALQTPFSDSYAWYLLMEVTGPKGIRDRVESALADCLETGLLPDAVIAESAAQRQNLWDLRENTPEANRMTGAICNSDTAVPVSQIARFIRLTIDEISGVHPGLRLNSYGHIGDGNIHHNVFPPEGVAKKDFIAEFPGINDDVRMAINKTTMMCGGSISAEHGIGRLKKADAAAYVDATKQSIMRQIKKAMDPNNILNPGALL